MPPRGYRTLTLREDVYKRLKSYMEAHGFSSPSDALAHILAQASTCEHLNAKTEELEVTTRKIYLIVKKLAEECK